MKLHLTKPPKLLGRPLSPIDTTKLISLRKDGYTISQITRMMKTSKGVVWRGLKRLEIGKK